MTARTIRVVFFTPPTGAEFPNPTLLAPHEREPASGPYGSYRVVPYVPESELERYRAVVGEVLRVIQLGASDKHAKRCFLDELKRQGFTTEGAVVK